MLKPTPGCTLPSWCTRLGQLVRHVEQELAPGDIPEALAWELRGVRGCRLVECVCLLVLHSLLQPGFEARF